ncbi:hypothetical protein PAXINDRAFT_172322 [Paxillus involutus ATCC 200175]|uniref:Uncharacterized protein n=1 Tax=Paxillus involutus ATCC 200175 TaxID=664439 RepID=A0A0C9TGC7_PAXIN|nr:hypothetical protein PAXINDRAFT_172322 [Paxillus involutus ATCC 200175]
MDLGAVSKYDPEIFPLSSYRGRDSLGRGDFLLDATLDEMLKITAMGTDLSQDSDFIMTTKAKYDELMLKKEKLEKRPKSLNPFKVFANYRAIRLFYVSTKSLYLETRSTSEKMKRLFNRKILSVPSEDVAPAENAPPPGANISGIAVTLDGPLDDDAERTITDAANTLASCLDPFADNPFITQLTSVTESMFSNSDPLSVAAVNEAAAAFGPTKRTSSASSSSQTSESTSPASAASVTNIFVLHNSVMAPNSSVHGATLNQGGSRNSGSVTDQITPEMLPSVS